tara:strand:- start:549 stop:665 length:117 start_codon:yes stop_codon:yes gene_type:complete
LLLVVHQVVVEVVTMVVAVELEVIELQDTDHLHYKDQR